VPTADPELAAGRFALYRRLLALRRRHISPALEGARALDARAVGPAGVVARWKLGNGKVLTIAVNLGEEAHDSAADRGYRDGEILFESVEGAYSALCDGLLLDKSTVAILQ
jgi:glycosidase